MHSLSGGLYTVKHILANCSNFTFRCQQFYDLTSLEDLFKKMKVETILA